MSTFPPILFKSTDAGAPAMEGVAGALLEVLSSCLICRSMFTAVGGASFVDHTVEARTQGGTGFALFQGPTVTVDEAYVGMTARFGRAKLVFGTPGVQNAAVTLAWEYWNGSAWTALSGVVDGTAELTVDGTVVWTIPSDWVAVSVNSVTQFWIRVRFTAGSWTANPLVATLSVTGWSQPFAVVSNEAAYQQGGGNQFFMNIDDDGPGAGTAKEARIRGFETMAGLADGTGLFPTTVQLANGLFIRKSVAADGMDRPWYVLADDRTVYVFVATADGAAGRYFGFMFGDMFSLVTNDSYRTILIARTTENSGVATVGTENLHLLNVGIVGQTGVITPAAPAAGHYMARAYTGVGVSVQVAKHGDSHKAQSPIIGAGGLIVLPNPPDGGFYISPVWVCAENAAAVLRGRMRGMWQFLHPVATITDGDVFSGAGALAGKSFVVIKFTAEGTGLYVMETSDTWETN